jgi:hypothetical protein
MQQALDELYQAEGHPAGRGDGLSLLQEVLAQKRTADPFYDTFDAIDRVPPVRNGSVASSETSSIASQPPIVKGTSVKDLAKNFDAMNESRRSPSAASLERLLEKDRSRRERLIPDLLPQRHPTYMSTTVVMGSTPHPTPQPQHNLARSATKTRPDGPDVALGASPGRSGSVEAATPRGSD